MTARLRRLAARFWPLVPTALLVICVYIYFNRHDTTTRTLAWILLVAGLSYAFASIVLLWFTQRWALRGQGQLCTMIGDAVLYTSVSISILHGHRLDKSYTDAVRSLLVVGGPLLVAGLFWWIFKEWRTRR